MTYPEAKMHQKKDRNSHDVVWPMSWEPVHWRQCHLVESLISPRSAKRCLQRIQCPTNGDLNITFRQPKAG